MAKAGAVGCVIGMGTETVVSYRQWKEGCLLLFSTLNDAPFLTLNKAVSA